MLRSTFVYRMRRRIVTAGELVELENYQRQRGEERGDGMRNGIQVAGRTRWSLPPPSPLFSGREKKAAEVFQVRDEDRIIKQSYSAPAEREAIRARSRVRAGIPQNNISQRPMERDDVDPAG